MRPGGKSATSLGTAGSTCPLPTLEEGHEHANRSGVVLEWSAYRIERDAATPFAAGEDHPGRNYGALAA